MSCSLCEKDFSTTTKLDDHWHVKHRQHRKPTIVFQLEGKQKIYKIYDWQPLTETLSKCDCHVSNNVKWRCMEMVQNKDEIGEVDPAGQLELARQRAGKNNSRVTCHSTIDIGPGKGNLQRESRFTSKTPSNF